MNTSRKSCVTRIRLLMFVLALISLFASQPTSAKSAVESLPKVGLIPDGPVDDHSFNQMAYEGLTQAVDENLVEGHVYQPAGNTDPDYTAAINQCVAELNLLCLTVGFTMGNATMAAALSNPAVHFGIVDVWWDAPAYPSNLRGITMASDEAAYLAGSLAGLMTESGHIGIVAGMPIPTVDNFVIPYTFGAQWANHLVDVITNYAYDFQHEDVGATLAQSQIDRGADVIFGVGGSTGNGAIKKAASLSKYCIGVDVDEYFTAFEGGAVDGSEYLLTSVLKRIDNAVYSTISDHLNGTFTPGTYVYDMASGGVGLAPYHETEPDIPPEVISYLETVSTGIMNGSIDVWQPFYSHAVFLPVILR